jgi:AcrR family transcriptional regulator
VPSVSSEESQDLGPLPAGRHGYSREQVAHSQHERLIAALTQVVNERGYNEVTIADITAAAQVSRRTFYEHFDSREACFLAAFDVVVEHLLRLIEEATEPIPDWPHRVSAALAVVLRFFAAEPELARLCMVESLTAGPAVTERYREVILGFTPLLKPGREERAQAQALPDSTEDTIVGSVASVISRSIMSGETAELEKLLSDFIGFTLMPYLGPEEARRIAAEAVNA